MKSTQTRVIKTSILIAFLAGICLIIVFFPIQTVLLDATEWIKQQGFWGYICYIVAFWLEILCGIPSTVFEALAGFIFGFWPALLVTTIGKTGGCMGVFVVGQFLGKDTIGTWMKKRFPTFKAMVKVFKNSDVRFLCLFQLAYLPIFVKCFGLSIMDVDIVQFFVTTVVCGIPYTIFWSYIGSQSHDLLELLSGESNRAISHEKIVFIALGVSSGIFAMVLLARYTKIQLDMIRKNNEATENAMKGAEKAEATSTPEEATTIDIEIDLSK